MPYGKNTPEYKRVKENNPQISAAIAGVIDTVSEELLAKGLITSDHKDAARNDMIGARKRASDLVSLILNKVEQDTQNFQKFVEVLQQDPDTFETVLKRMGVSDGNPSQSGHVTNSSVVDTETVQKQSATASSVTFSDALSPTQLVAWLSQQFQAKGLTLDQSLGQKLIDDDINGEAFMDLKDKDLDEMGFKRGQRMKITKIIQSVQGGNKEKVPSQKQASVPVQREEETVDPSLDHPPVLSIATLTRLKRKGKEVEIIKAVASDWMGFGFHLNFDPVGRDLGNIKKKNGDPVDCCQDMFRHWLNGNGIEASWSNVIDILDAVGLKILAKEVRDIVQ